MKRAFIGGFFSLIGSIWALSILTSASANLVSGWATPPGRLLCTVFEMGLTVWFVLAIALLVLGLAVMAAEYFRKEK